VTRSKREAGWKVREKASSRSRTDAACQNEIKQIELESPLRTP
jgi:hypothetical protein